MTDYKRTNGFSWPPDKYQVIAWTVLIYLGLSVFGSLCVSLAHPWSIIISVLFAIIYLTHVGFNIACMAINPGEEAVLKRKIVPQSNFDRQKHRHVIENQFCNICQIVVSLKAKHCKRCNKCITDFDHHCIYLNNCVGGRNYRIFIMTIVSAFVGSVFTFVIAVAEFMASFFSNQHFLTKSYHIKNSTLCNLDNCDDQYKAYPIFAPAPVNLWRVFVMITVLLALVASVLIGYLIAYHIFLKINNMSTYEHTVMLKQKSDQEKANSVLKENSFRSKHSSSQQITKTSSLQSKEPNSTLKRGFSIFKSEIFQTPNRVDPFQTQANSDNKLAEPRRNSLTNSSLSLKKQNNDPIFQIDRIEYYSNSEGSLRNIRRQNTCINSEINNNYLVVENETPRESKLASITVLPNRLPPIGLPNSGQKSEISLRPLGSSLSNRSTTKLISKNNSHSDDDEDDSSDVIIPRTKN